MDGFRNELVYNFKRFYFIGVIMIMKMCFRIYFLLIIDVYLNRFC